MRLALLCLCISGWWASLSSPSLAISVKYLAHASRDGDIVVRAHSFVGFQITALHILNQRDTDLELDVNGSYLRPQVEGVQRIGIGIVRGGSGSSRLRLSSACGKASSNASAITCPASPPPEACSSLTRR